MQATDMLPKRSTFERIQGSPWRVVGTVCIGAFMAALDASIVSTANTTFQEYFHTSVSIVGWIAIAYLLTLSSLLIVFGRMADSLGRSRMYAYGFSVFIVGSVLCGASPTIGFLIGARVLQAAGAAMLQANSVALVTLHTPPRDRGKAIGIQGAAQAIGLSVGPAVGGAILAAFSWRYLFYVNVPIGVVGTLLAMKLLPKDPPRQPLKTFDLRGATLMVATLVAFLFAMNDGYKLGWSSPSIVISFVIAVVGAYLFIRWERVAPSPLLDFSLFESWIFTSGNISGMLSYTLMYGSLFMGPYELRTVLGLPYAQMGAVLAAVPVAMTIISPIAGRLADHHGAKGLSIVGMVLGTLGALVIALSSDMHQVLPVLIGFILIGAGMGLFTAPNNSSVMGVVPKAHLSAAGGFLNMARSLGMSLGVAAAASIYGSILLGSIGTEKVTAKTVPVAAHAIMVAFLGLGILSALAALVAALKPTSRFRGSPDGLEEIDLI